MKKSLTILITSVLSMLLASSAVTANSSSVWEENVTNYGIHYVINTVHFNLSFDDHSSSIAKLIGDEYLDIAVFEDNRFALLIIEKNGDPVVNTSEKSLSDTVTVRDGDDVETEITFSGVQEPNKTFILYSGDLISNIRDMEEPHIIFKYSLEFSDTTAVAEQSCQILNLQDLFVAYDNMMASIADSNAA